jgi:hypothetical protein
MLRSYSLDIEPWVVVFFSKILNATALLVNDKETPNSDTHISSSSQPTQGIHARPLRQRVRAPLTVFLNSPVGAERLAFRVFRARTEDKTPKDRKNICST